MTDRQKPLHILHFLNPEQFRQYFLQRLINMVNKPEKFRGLLDESVAFMQAHNVPEYHTAFVGLLTNRELWSAAIQVTAAKSKVESETSSAILIKFCQQFHISIANIVKEITSVELVKIYKRQHKGNNHKDDAKQMDEKTEAQKVAAAEVNFAKMRELLEGDSLRDATVLAQATPADEETSKALQQALSKIDLSEGNKLSDIINKKP